MKTKKLGSQISFLEVLILISLVVLFGKPLFDLMVSCDHQCQVERRIDKDYRDQLRIDRQVMQEERKKLFREYEGR